MERERRVAWEVVVGLVALSLVVGYFARPYLKERFRPVPVVTATPTPSPTPVAVITPTPPPPPNTWTGVASTGLNVGPIGAVACESKLTAASKKVVAGNLTGDPVCPTSKAPYILVSNASLWAIVCPGHAHEKGTTQLYSSKHQDVLDAEEWQPEGLEEDYLKALVHTVVYELPEADKAWEKVVVTDKFPDAAPSWADILVQMGRGTDALKVLQADKSTEGQQMKIMALALNEQYEEAESLANSVGTPVAKTFLAQLHALQNEFDQAESEMDEAGPDYHWAKAYIRLGERDYAGCLDLVEQQAGSWKWTDPRTPPMVCVAVLAARAGSGELEGRGKKLLADALVKVPKIWPYPVLRYLNGELDDAALLKEAGPDDPHRTEAAMAVGCMQAIRKDEAFRETLGRVTNPLYLEKIVAQAWLK